MENWCDSTQWTVCLSHIGAVHHQSIAAPHYTFNSSFLSLRSVTAVRLTCFCSQMSFSKHQYSFNIYVYLSNAMHVCIYVIRFSVFLFSPCFHHRWSGQGCGVWLHWVEVRWCALAPGVSQLLPPAVAKKNKKQGVWKTFLTILTAINQQCQRFKNEIRTILTLIYTD